MNKLYPHIYFWLTAISIIIISELSILNISDAVSMSIRDTYYVVAKREVSIVFSSLYLFAGLIYWLFQKINIKLNINLIRLHTFVSISTVMVYYIFLIYFRYFKTKSLFESSNETYINLILIFTTLLIQVHFIYNIIYSVIKHNASKKTQ